MCGSLIDPRSKKCSQCIRKGENSPTWKGDDVTYSGIHKWIRDNKPKSKECEYCAKITRLQAANLSGEYKRDINDFVWLCASCHRKMDNAKATNKLRNKHRNEIIEIFGEQNEMLSYKLIEKYAEKYNITKGAARLRIKQGGVIKIYYNKKRGIFIKPKGYLKINSDIYDTFCNN